MNEKKSNYLHIFQHKKENYFQKIQKVINFMFKIRFNPMAEMTEIFWDNYNT